MAAGIAVFGTEGRAESINVGKGAGKEFTLQLTTNGQTGSIAKKILPPIDGSIQLRWPSRIEGGDPKHLAGSLAIVAGDNWRMDVEKPPLPEKIMNCERQSAAHSKHGTKSIGPRPQMSDGSEVLEGMAFLLQRIVSVAGS